VFSQEPNVSISTPGIGSGLDVNGIISKLMAVESQPLSIMDTKIASYQSQITALGQLSSALGTFQGSLNGLTSLSAFQTLTSTPSDPSVVSGVASSAAKAGIYSVNVQQIAQAQRLNSGGYASTTSAIGLGGSTTVSFQLGTASGGSFGLTGTQLGAGLNSGGLTPGGLTINGTTIATDSSTKSAKLLADAINAKSSTTGVSATASPTRTDPALFGSGGASSFGNIDTSSGASYSLSVGGVQIASQAGGIAAGSGVTAASIDAILAGKNSTTTALAQANITFTGSAAAGTLQFINSDGSNVSVNEDVIGSGVTGGINTAAGNANTAYTNTFESAISLVSTNGSQIAVGGTNPALAGLTAGTGGSYLGAAFTQDGGQASGSIVIDSSNNTLQGIADAINKGNFGVSAAIVNDGSEDAPNHLVLTSSATGATSTMKISLSGTASGTTADSALSSLLGYDPSSSTGQNMHQSQAAQSTIATISGVNVTSTSTSITGAIPGVAVNVLKVGSSTLTVANDSNSLLGAVTSFVTAYNTLNTAISALTANDQTTTPATVGPLLGDTATQALQAQLRSVLTASITGLSSSAGLTNLGQIGITLGSPSSGTTTNTSSDASMQLDTTKLNAAISTNFSDIAGLFAAVGKSTDPNMSFVSSTAATKAGDYAVNITTLASQGTETGLTPLAASTTIDPNTTWTVTLNDTDPSTASNTATVTIPPGTYTPKALATAIQSAINGASNFSKAGSAVTATVDPTTGALDIVSNLYGSKSNILLSDATGTSIDTLMGSAKPVAGVDVAGTIGGYSAVGSGQTLTGGPGAPVTGLVLKVTGGTTGQRGTVGFSQGYAYQLNNMATGFLGTSGTIASETTGLNSSIKDVNSEETDFKARLVTIEANYRTQYTALDVTIASMNTTQTFLTQQFAAIAAQA
jgi:flagellar hook-associated protein 2